MRRDDFYIFRKTSLCALERERRIGIEYLGELLISLGEAAVRLIVEEGFLEVIYLAVLDGSQRLPYGIASVCFLNLLLRRIRAGMALYYDDVGVCREYRFEVDFQTLCAACVVPVVNDVLRFHRGYHSADNGCGGVGIELACVGKHAEYAGCIFIGNLAENIYDIVERFHGDAVPELGMTGEIAEYLEPFEIIGEIIVFYGDNGDACRLGGLFDGGEAAHRCGADDKLGLERHNLLGIPLLAGG